MRDAPIEGFAAGEETRCRESFFRKQELIFNEVKESLGIETSEVSEATLELMAEVNRIFEHEPVIDVIPELKRQGPEGSSGTLR